MEMIHKSSISKFHVVQVPGMQSLKGLFSCEPVDRWEGKPGKIFPDELIEQNPSRKFVNSRWGFHEGKMRLDFLIQANLTFIVTAVSRVSILFEDWQELNHFRSNGGARQVPPMWSTGRTCGRCRCKFGESQVMSKENSQVSCAGRKDAEKTAEYHLFPTE